MKRSDFHGKKAPGLPALPWLMVWNPNGIKAQVQGEPVSIRMPLFPTQIYRVLNLSLNAIVGSLWTPGEEALSFLVRSLLPGQSGCLCTLTCVEGAVLVLSVTCHTKNIVFKWMGPQIDLPTFWAHLWASWRTGVVH